MKKLLLLLFLLLGFSFITEVFAYSATTTKFITAFEKQMKGMTKEKQKSYLSLISSIMDTPKVKASQKPEIKTLITEMKLWIAEKNGEKKTSGVIVKPSDGSSYQILNNVDFNKVRDTILSRHNEIRENNGSAPLSYHSDLEKSAVTWAKNLADNQIKNGTHKRLESDGYYNYNSIKDWFGNLGISFIKESGGKAVFSESVGYRNYKCVTSDCTETLLAAVKKVFDSFVAEGSSGVHYKAIVLPHFKYLGMGFGVDSSNVVYVVFHYAEEIIE